MPFRALARALPLLAAVLVSACRGSSEPAFGPPSKLALISAPMFTATVGAPLQAPVVVRVTDDVDRPVPNVAVQFTVTQGVATVAPARDSTDAEGLAQTTVTLGTLAGPVTVTASVTGISTTVTVTGVAIPGALARLVLTPKPLLLRAVGDTARLFATLSDQYGNPLPPSAITWRSLDETVATVDASGLVTGRRVGASTRIVGTTSSGLTDEVTVSVADPNASVCGGPPVTLAPGQTTTVDAALGACIRATDASQYVMIPFFASSVNTNTTEQLQVVGNGVATFIAPAAMAAPSSSTSLLSAVTPRPSASFEAGLRTVERRDLAPRRAAARAARTTRTGGGVSFNTVPNAAVGDLITINASAQGGAQVCSAPDNRIGRVVALTQKAVIVSDTTSPAGGFTDDDFRRIGAMFDTLVVPVNEETFGMPGDIDGNGRSVIFYTPAVNKLTTAGSGQYVGGFFFVRDLFPKAECASSNAGEIFFMLAPDPTGVFGNTFSKAFVEQVTVGTLAHEYQHLINASKRIVNPAADWEETWLNEGLSHIAEEMVFYRAAGLSPRQNIDGSRFGTQPFDQAYANYMHQNLGRLRSWLGAPESNAPYAANDELATRGSAWIYLRYMADRRGPSDGDVWRRLVDNAEAGAANIEEVFATNLVSSVRDWGIAMYADDYASGIPLQYVIASWNLRRMYPNMVNSSITSIRNSTLRGPYPLTVRPLINGEQRPVTLRGGGNAYFPFAVAAGTDAQVRISTVSGGPAPSGVLVTVLRTR